MVRSVLVKVAVLPKSRVSVALITLAIGVPLPIATVPVKVAAPALEMVSFVVATSLEPVWNNSDVALLVA